MIYFLTFNISALFLKFTDLTKSKKFKIILTVVSALILILLFGLRYQVGTDYNNYVKVYEQVSNLSFTSIFSLKDAEIGHYILCYIICFFGFDYRMLFVVYGILIFVFFYKSINKFKVNKVFYLIAYLFILFPFSLNIMRQGLATVMIIYAIGLLFEKKNLKSYVLLLLAMLIHLPCIILLPFFLVQTIFKKKKLKIITLTTIYLLFLIFMRVNNNIIYIDFLSKYINYTISDSNLLLRISRELILKIPVFILLLISYKELKNKDENSIMIITMFFIGMITLLFFSINPTMNRFGLYFRIFDIILLGQMAMNKNNVKKAFIYLYCLLVFIHVFCLNGYAEIFPYKTWLGL